MTSIEIIGSNNNTSLILSSEKAEISTTQSSNKTDETPLIEQAQELNLGFLAPLLGGLKNLGRPFVRFAIYPLLEILQVSQAEKNNIINNVETFISGTDDKLTLTFEKLNSNLTKISKINFYIANSQCDGVEAVKSANYLLENNVTFIIGAACSGASLQLLEDFNVPNNIPLISYANTSDQFTIGTAFNGLYARTAPSDALQGALNARLALKIATNVVTIYRTDSYGTGLNKAFVDEFRRNSGNVLKLIGYSNEDNYFESIKSQLDEIKNINEEFVIYSVLFPETTDILSYLKENTNAKAYFFSDGAKNDDLLSLFPENSFVTTPGSSTEIIEKYYSVLSSDNWKSTYAAQIYDAVALALLSSVIGGSGSQLIKNVGTITALRTQSDIEVIRAGELTKALQLLNNKKDIVYHGASFTNMKVTASQGYEPAGSSETFGLLYNLYSVSNNQFVEQTINV